MPDERNPLLYLDDILESCQRIQEYVQEAEEDDFTENKLVLDAVVRNLKIVRDLIENKVPELERKV